jgi:spore coat polysaccharide biosynthesis protein SpsF
MLARVVERCRAARRADAVVVATSTDPSDDPIARWCTENATPCFRGSLDDVLARYRAAAQRHALDAIVRVTADCPFIAPNILDETIALFWREAPRGIAYVSNILDRVYPRGLDCEVLSRAALEEADARAETTEEREHVTVYMRKHCTAFPYTVPEEYRGGFRLTVDEQADYDLASLLYEKFRVAGSLVDVRAVINFLSENPDIASVNSHIEQKKVSA